MKRILLTTGIVAALVLGTGSAASAAPTSFSSCTQVHQYYKGGIAKVGVKGNRNQYTHKLMAFEHQPKFSTALYKKNSFLDRDNDGVVCEG
jgi:Excalibur calcium-binding domain